MLIYIRFIFLLIMVKIVCLHSPSLFTFSLHQEAEEERYGGMMVFNREMEEKKREREKNWQEELEESMRLSDPTGHGERERERERERENVS